MNLTRRGAINSTATSFGNMDILAYGYGSNSNKLTAVNDTGNITYGFKDASSLTTQYTYDANGNMKTDTNKGITAIAYNHLNLPTSITLGGGTISYIYDATGVKQRKVIGGTTTEYASGFIYENNILKQFSHSEGYVEPDGSGGFQYVYSYLDHLGNTRLYYSDLNGNGTIEVSSEILDERNYYPFGLEHQGYNTTIVSENNYKTYQGKENQKELGLNWHDFGARQYDAALGRWFSPDPLSEEFSSWSPYNAMSDNPINFIDPTGMAAEWIPKVNQDGSTSYIAEAGDDASTLQSQYGLDDGVAEQIIGDKKIETGDVVSGKDVATANGGNEVLQLDLSSDLATDQRVLDQFVFATDYSKSEGKFDFKPSEFYSNRMGASPYIGKANLNTSDGSVPVYFQLTLYNPNPYSENSSTSEFPISNTVNEPGQSRGQSYSDVYFFYRTANKGKPARTDGAKLYSNGNSRAVINRFKN